MADKIDHIFRERHVLLREFSTYGVSANTDQERHITFVRAASDLVLRNSVGGVATSRYVGMVMVSAYTPTCWLKRFNVIPLDVHVSGCGCVE